MLTHVVDNRLALCNNNLFVRARGCNANHRRASQRVDLLQVILRAEVCVTLEDFDLIVEVQLLEQPYDALASGLLEPAGC